MAVLDTVIGFLAPHDCIGCGIEGSLVCEWCAPSVVSPLPPRCVSCHKIMKNYETCPSCQKTLPLRHVWVVSEYQNLANTLVYKLKFERAIAAAAYIARLMHETMPYFENLLVGSVPTATSHQRQRGYDQAELIARSFAKLRGLPYENMLLRRGQSRQVGANRSERLRQLKGAFQTTKPDRINGRHILLIDDVVTTAATIGEAARTLKAAGARQVNAAVFAQKQ